MISEPQLKSTSKQPSKAQNNHNLGVLAQMVSDLANNIQQVTQSVNQHLLAIEERITTLQEEINQLKG